MAREMRDVVRRRSAGITPTAPDAVLALDDARARDAARAGAKAAALAIALANEMPVLPGFVVPASAPMSAMRTAWEALSDHGRRPLAVRSSSALEDQATQSMAGQFATVLDVVGWDDTVDAIATVRSSAGGAPMAVLLQPMCDAAIGGVLFGVDPVSGRTDRLVIEMVEGGPTRLVSGEVSASREVLRRRGRRVDGADVLSNRDRRRLAALARNAARVFGQAQDIEWAIDRDGRLWLLQSRPITAIAHLAAGPLLGPGPVAETFPDPLSPLELDLWAEPLRAAIIEALRLVGAQSRRAIDASPVLVDVGGRLAVDLELLEGRARVPARSLRTIARRVDPRPGGRRFVASWRVGRLRRSLPLLARDVVDDIDGMLTDVPRLDRLTDDALVSVLGRCRFALRSLHAHETLAGVLLAADDATGLEHALGAVWRSRSLGLSDDEIASTAPIALALVAPRIGAPPTFPVIDREPTHLRSRGGELGTRESLRLRARWVQELSARAATVLGVRLATAGRLDDALNVRWLTLEELVAIVRDRADVPTDVWVRLATDAPAPLPAGFRLTPDGGVVAVEIGRPAAGRGAGGGRGAGPVAGPADDPDRTVLVVRTLDPRLASVLAGRAGLVAETGSVLSHLAIVARELGVPTVVGVAGAVERFPPGTRLLVDGTSGDVEVLA